VRESLHAQADFAAEHDEDGFVEAYSARVREGTRDGDAILQAAPPDQLYMGLRRYLTKSGRVPSE
jgi:hypothetical protein